MPKNIFFKIKPTNLTELNLNLKRSPGKGYGLFLTKRVEKDQNIRVSRISRKFFGISRNIFHFNKIYKYFFFTKSCSPEFHVIIRTRLSRDFLAKLQVFSTHSDSTLCVLSEGARIHMNGIGN